VLVFASLALPVADMSPAAASAHPARTQREGRILVTSKAGWSDCQDGNVCLYSNQQYSGQLVQFSDCCAWINLGGFSNTESSWRNRRNNDAVLATGQDGSGDHLCLNNNDSDPVMSDAWRNVASSVRNRDVSDLC
jgi:hypothetical protein